MSVTHILLFIYIYIYLYIYICIHIYIHVSLGKISFPTHRRSLSARPSPFFRDHGLPVLFSAWRLTQDPVGGGYTKKERQRRCGGFQKLGRPFSRVFVVRIIICIYIYMYIWVSDVPGKPVAHNYGILCQSWATWLYNGRLFWATWLSR